MGKIFQILLAVIGISVGYALYIISQTKSQSIPIPYAIDDTIRRNPLKLPRQTFLLSGINLQS